jgi:prepilin-type N-terminal cleavage/methylation domain-containing protein
MKTSQNVCTIRAARTKGFTLLEFLVAMAVFMIVTGSVFSLFRKDDPLFNQQQSVSGVNIALQNAITQMQLDVVNAGSGYYAGANIPNFPVGVTIAENMVAGVVTAPAVGDCGDNTQFLYHADCFDTLNIITSDPATSPQHPAASSDTSTGAMVLSTPTITTNTQALALAAFYHSGDTLLVLAVDGSTMTTVKLTTTPTTVSGAVVTLHFTATSSAGVNPQDTLLLTTHSGGTTDNSHTQLSSTYGTSDWVLRLQPITYTVDDSNPADPKLTRTLAGVSDVVAEQVIGFKVGASLANQADNFDSIYKYDASQFGVSPGFDFSIIRSIRATVIGRTPPSASSASTVLNSYDNGPYKIQGLSVAINPRNLSMGDN